MSKNTTTINSTFSQNNQNNTNNQDFKESINRSLDETKQNINRSIDESKNQIPRYNTIVKSTIKNNHFKQLKRFQKNILNHKKQ